MKRGKKYVEAAKAIDRGTLYDVADAVSLVKKTAVAKFDETIELISEPDVTDVTQISRSVVPLYFLTEPVRKYVSWYLQRTPRLMRHRQQAQITLAARS